VRRDLPTATRALAVPTLALVLVLAFAPGRTELAVRTYALVLSGAALALALAALRRAYPAARPLRPSLARRDDTRRPPPGLARLEHELALGVAGSFDLHHRLVPRLRSVAAGLLRARRRLSLTADPEAARAILGDEAWELVRADRSAPEDRLARGVPVTTLRRAVDSLERI